MMSQNDPLLAADTRAMQLLDIYFGMWLGCSPSDLRRSSWTIVAARLECDPTALLFEQRPILSIVAPVCQSEEERGGVAMVAPELRAAIAALLKTASPREVFSAQGLRTLDAVVARLSPTGSTRPADAHIRLTYTSRESFRPYAGRWQEWIEPLDDTTETAPMALGLLARYGGGVYAVRRAGAIISHAGIRCLSPTVAEIGVRTYAEDLCGRGLGRAVMSRATKAILATERVPLFRFPMDHLAAQRMCAALGYRHYADAISYFAALR